jgi:hypothetical protein
MSASSPEPTMELEPGMTFRPVINVLPTPFEKRDYYYEGHVDGVARHVGDILDEYTLGEEGPLTLPKTVDLRVALLKGTGLFKPRDQGPHPTCLAFAAASMMMYREANANGIKQLYSPRFIYELRLNGNDTRTDNDWGMFAFDAMNIMNKFGVPSEIQYPYDWKKPMGNKASIPQPVYEAALQSKIGSYAWCNTLAAARLALAFEGPLLLTVPVYNYGPRMWMPAPGQPPARSGHAMLIVGCSGDEKNGSFLVMNSWGTRWNRTGFCRFPYADWGMHWEVIALVDERRSATMETDTEM